MIKFLLAIIQAMDKSKIIYAACYVCAVNLSSTHVMPKT